MYKKHLYTKYSFSSASDSQQLNSHMTTYIQFFMVNKTDSKECRSHKPRHGQQEFLNNK